MPLRMVLTWRFIRLRMSKLELVMLGFAHFFKNLFVDKDKDHPGKT